MVTPVIGDLIARRRLSDFSKILGAYRSAGIDLGNVIDGGAGWGSTAKGMLPQLGPNARVYAFEPFPGNHRFFEGMDPRVVLYRNALGDEAKTMAFRVPSVVQAGAAHGSRLEGYSSVGALVASKQAGDLEVECVRADDLGLENVGAIKLDLQGGERAALRGMVNLLPQAQIMWVEYALPDAEIIQFLSQHGFDLYDAEYNFKGEPSDAMREAFDVTREGVVKTTGVVAWFGFKRSPWRDFVAEFAELRKSERLVQTDLLCVNRAYRANFEKAMATLPA